MSDSKKIEPRVLKGFRDTMPELALLRNEMMHKLEGSFLSFGFTPIDTPALELSEILLGKGSAETDKQLFRFQDQGGRDVALRFDLTVPLARFVSQHSSVLQFPFKRFHMAPVWRAEKPQKGRYREFIQCDFDIIGADSRLADAEILILTQTALRALDIKAVLRVNNRRILNCFLSSLGKTDSSVAVLRAIDKLEKSGAETVIAELQTEAGLSTEQIEQVLKFVSLSQTASDTEQMLESLRNFFEADSAALSAVAELEEIIQLYHTAIPERDSLQIDLSIARGLDYYTGLVAETRFVDLPQIGSIASGGRYNDLASLYTKQRLPGVGFSIGLDRILGAYEELKRIPSRSSASQVLLALLDPGTEPAVLTLASELRAQGIKTEVYLEHDKLGNQIKYADKKHIPYLILLGKKELAQNTCTLKILASGQQVELPRQKTGEYIIGL